MQNGHGTGPWMLQAAVKTYETQGGVPVTFAAHEAFFPLFDDRNKELERCCVDLMHQATHCSVNSARPPVKGRTETCDALKVRCCRFVGCPQTKRIHSLSTNAMSCCSIENRLQKSVGTRSVQEFCSHASLAAQLAWKAQGQRVCVHQRSVAKCMKILNLGVTRAQTPTFQHQL